MRKYTKTQVKRTKVRIAEVLETTEGLQTIELEPLMLIGDFSERKLKAEMKKANLGANVVILGTPTSENVVYYMETKEFMEKASVITEEEFNELTKGDNE